MAELVRDRDSASFLLGEMNIIGRDASCDLVLADPRVSQIHARVLRQGPTWMLEDLASRNGTALRPGCKLCFDRVASTWPDINIR